MSRVFHKLILLVLFVYLFFISLSLGSQKRNHNIYIMAVPILIYEDNELLRESIGNMLSLTTSYQVSGQFGDVLNIESQVINFNPHLILMDIDMPGMTGIEAVKRIRSTGNEIPILMLTVF